MVELELGKVGFRREGTTGVPEKNLSEQMRERTKTQPTYGTTPGFEPRATLVGGDCSHHCTTLAHGGDDAHDDDDDDEEEEDDRDDGEEDEEEDEEEEDDGDDEDEDDDDDDNSQGVSSLTVYSKAVMMMRGRRTEHLPTFQYV